MNVRYFPIPFENFVKMQALDLSYTTQLIYINLCKLSNTLAESDGWFYRSLACLQKDTKMQRNTILTGLKNLEKEGFIEIVRDFNTSAMNTGVNHYKVKGFVFKNFKMVEQETQPSWLKKRN